MSRTATVEVAQQPVADPVRGGLLRRLEPIFRSTPANPLTARQWLLALAAVVVGTLLSLLRQPGSGRLDTMWAEDGQIFLADAVNKSFLHALVTPYNGYYQAVPRLLIEPVLLVPARWAAATISVEAALVTALFAVVVYVASGAHLRSRLARLLAASIAVASPTAINGIPVSLANVHWPGLYALFWVLLWVPGSRSGRILTLVLAALLPATNILAIVFIPLAILRALVVRDWLSRVVAALVTLGVLLHGYALATGSTSRELHPTISGAVTSYFKQAVPATLVGEQGLYLHPSARLNLAWTVLAWLVALGLVVLAWRGPFRPNWLIAGLAALYSALLWGAAVASTGVAVTRYIAASGMLLIGGVAALLVPGPDRRSRFVTGAALVLVLLIYGSNLSTDYRSAPREPSWATEVHRGQQQCRATPGATAVNLPNAPQAMGWLVHLRCGYLLR